MRIRNLVLAVLALLLAVPSAASAAINISRSGDVVLAQAPPGDKVNLSVSGEIVDGQSELQFSRGNGQIGDPDPPDGLAVGDGCGFRFLQLRVGCFMPFSLTSYRVTGAEKDDVVNASFDVGDPRRPGEIILGAGNDRAILGSDADILRGGPGNDVLSGGTGGDQVLGEAGDDQVLGVDGDDVVDGGVGSDTLVLSDLVANNVVSLNGLADDGPGGGTANVLDSVENVRGGTQGDQIIGGPGPNRLEGRGGNDTIDARGGAVDTVDCGDGVSDRAIVDLDDTVAGCEVVERVAPVIDVDGDGSSPPADCDDAAPGVRPGAIEIPGNGIDDNCSDGDAALPVVITDRDGDGAVVPADCDDTSPAVKPGQLDVPENGVDEDCSGRDAALAVVPAKVAFQWTVFRTHTRAAKLRVSGVPAGGRVQLRCDGPGCPPARRTVKPNRKGVADLARLLNGRRLRPGAVVEVRVSAEAAITKVTRFRMRAGKPPKRASLCLPAGVRKPRPCG